jgi:hypothetical protein
MMKQDETALVKQALRDAREQLERGVRVTPGAYMLVTLNPQTGAPLTHPTAIGSQREQPFESSRDYREFCDTLRAEARRLKAIAVVLAGEAEAEIETTQGAERRRVFYVRVEDDAGVHQMHAPIESRSGRSSLGSLLADPDAPDEVEQRLLPAQ